MPFGLGFFATAGGSTPVAAGSFDLLESQVLGSPAANVTFSNLASSYASTYQHLQLRIVALHSADQNGKMNFNNDTGSSYSWHQLQGNGSSASSYGTGDIWMQIGYGPNSTTQPVVSIIDLLDPFETTKYKTTRVLTGSASSTNNVKLMSGSWRSTDAISTIVVAEVGGSGSYKTGSRFSLYGWKAA